MWGVGVLGATQLDRNIGVAKREHGEGMRGRIERGDERRMKQRTHKRNHGPLDTREPWKRVSASRRLEIITAATLAARKRGE